VLKVAYALRGLLSQPREGGFWSQMLWQSRQPTLGRLVAEAMNWFYLMATVRRKTAEPGIHFFDQGLCQAIWSIVYEGFSTDITSQEALSRLAHSLPSKSIIVLVEARLDTIGTRLQLRPGLASRIEREMAAGMSATGFARGMGALARTQAAVARLARKGRITILQLDNDGDQELVDGAVRIADALRRLSAGSDEPAPLEMKDERGDDSKDDPERALLLDVVEESLRARRKDKATAPMSKPHEGFVLNPPAIQ
jgi:hypothetical protein